MKAVKKIIAVLKKLGIKLDPVVLVLILVLLPLLVAGIVWAVRAWRRRREAKQLEQGAAPGAPPPAPPEMHPRALLRVYRRFLDQLPAAFRRAIADFTPMVVLGPGSSGKTALIQSYTDCQRQQNQFLDSALEDPNLQIYLGSSVVVQELSANAVRDTSAAARKAFSSLWTRSLRGAVDPVVVVPIDIEELGRTPPDVAQSQAEVIRGKINLMSWVVGRSIEVRIALTHMDSIEGYREFAAFARKNDVRLRLKLAALASGVTRESSLREQLAGFERFLPLALTTLPSGPYRAVVRFLERAPENVGALGRFVEVLVAPDALSKPPVAGDVYLTASGPSAVGESPFHAPPLAPVARKHNPLLAHQIAALLVAAIPIGYFASGYSLERTLWQQAERALSSYVPAGLSPEDERLSRLTIARFTQRSERGSALHWFPSFFHPADERVAEELARRIRVGLLLPGLKAASAEEWAHLRTLYFLGLLYASRDNELGTTVRSNVRRWANATGLSEGLVRDYVTASVRTWNGEIPEADLPSAVSFRSQDKDERWLLFLQTLNKAMARKVLEALDLRDLQAEAQAIAADVRATAELVARFAEAPRILAMLEKSASASFRHRERYEGFFREVPATAEYRVQLARKDAVLTRVLEAKLPLAPPKPDTLELFAAKLKLLAQRGLDASPPLFFDVLGEQLRFDPATWSRVVQDSALRRHVFNFIGQNASTNGSIFFPPETSLPPVVMNPRSAGNAMFTGKAVLDGRYTARAYQKYVRPPLEELTRHVAELNADSDEYRMLEDFVYQEVQRYARAYTDALTQYYKAFGVHAEFADGVQVLVRQMRAERSPFSDLIQLVTDSTSLELGTASYYRPIAESLAPFANWRKLTATDPTATSAELDKYRAILEQIESALGQGGSASGDQPVAEGEQPVGPSDLELTVSPAGRIALTLLPRGRERSFRTLINGWLDDVGIRGFLREPFLSPIREIERIGRGDVEAVVADVWRRRMLLNLGGVLRRFPFDRSSRVDATPADLNGVLHPLNGQFFDLYRRFVVPITREQRDGDLAVVGGLDVPSGMYAVLNACKRLSERLWTPEGEPKPYKVKVAPVPFEQGQNPESVLTLVYLSSGSTSMFNFNQKAYSKTLEIDWTKTQTSQIGIQLTNISSRRNEYPNPKVSQDSHWSFLHLLEEATQRGSYWSWSFDTSEDGGRVTTATFMVEGDPWAPFRIQPQMPEEAVDLTARVTDVP